MHNRFERGKGVFSCETCERKTRGSTGSVIRVCSECYDVSGMENECQDGHTTWADAKLRALPILNDCVRKGGNEDRLRTVFPWVYELP
jgi:ribosome-binding protein aMBF1 (putative translation factor)